MLKNRGQEDGDEGRRGGGGGMKLLLALLFSMEASIQREWLGKPQGLHTLHSFIPIHSSKLVLDQDASQTRSAVHETETGEKHPSWLYSPAAACNPGPHFYIHLGPPGGPLNVAAERSCTINWPNRPSNIFSGEVKIGLEVGEG